MFDNFFNICCQNIPDFACYNGKWNELRSEMLIMQEYVDLFVNRFEIENLPDDFRNISGRNKAWLFMMFFSRGIAIFKDPVMGIQALPTTGEWKFNIVGAPTEWKVFGLNGYRKDLNDSNSVLIYNDYAYTIPFIKLLYNVQFMTECDMTHSQNLRAQRQPFIIEMEEDEKKSASTFENQLNNGTAVIAIRKRKLVDGKRVNQNPYEMRTFESGRQFAGVKLGADYKYFHNRNLSYLGINNENIEKKERVLVDEVNANNEVISSFYTTAFDCMKDGWERVNKMFGLNVRVTPKKLKSIKGDNENDSTLQQGVSIKERDSEMERTN